MSSLRIKTPLKKRYGMQHMKKREAKMQDRSTFRQRVEKSFVFLSQGMQIFDAAIATTYSRGKRLMWVNFALWVMLVVYLYLQRGH